MVEMQSGRFDQIGRLVMLVVMLAGLAACSATGTRIQAWNGPDLPESETATLNAPENIKVLSINGEGMASFLLEDLALSYGLKPGPTRVVFVYRSIWSQSDRREADEARVATVESDRVEVTFDARAGETYSFAFNEPEAPDEARKVAADFQARVVNSSGQVVARSEPYRAGAGTVAQSQAAGKVTQSQAVTNPRMPADSVTPPAAGASAPLPAAAGDMSTLEALKLLWRRASREEKEAFLREAFQ